MFGFVLVEVLILSPHLGSMFCLSWSCSFGLVLVFSPFFEWCTDSAHENECPSHAPKHAIMRSKVMEFQRQKWHAAGLLPVRAVGVIRGSDHQHPPTSL